MLESVQTNQIWEFLQYPLLFTSKLIQPFFNNDSAVLQDIVYITNLFGNSNVVLTSKIYSEFVKLILLPTVETFSFISLICVFFDLFLRAMIIYSNLFHDNFSTIPLQSYFIILAKAVIRFLGIFLRNSFL